jgi:hypothetical protein
MHGQLATGPAVGLKSCALSTLPVHGSRCALLYPFADLRASHPHRGARMTVARTTPGFTSWLPATHRDLDALVRRPTALFSLAKLTETATTVRTI